MEGRLLLDVIVGKGTAVLELLSSKDQTLLVRGDSLLVLDLALDVVDGVTRLDLKGDGLAGNYSETKLVKSSSGGGVVPPETVGGRGITHESSRKSA